MKCEWCKIAIPIIAIVLIVGIFSYQFIDPAPPKTIKIITGKTDGSYYHFATLYNDILKKERFNLQIIPSAGSVEALSMLEKGKADVAFIQGGTADKKETKNLISLGSIYFEPLWIFYKKGKEFNYLYQLKGKKLYIGNKGSGTRALALILLNKNNINEKNTKFVDLKGISPQDAIKEGKIDVIFSVISANSPKIKKLLMDDELKLFSFKRANAYSKIFPFLIPLTLNEGVMSLEKNIPNTPKTLLGTTATLVASKSIHPDWVRLLLKAAKKVHSKATIFSSENQFPTYKYTQIPMDEDAKNYIIKGDSFLEKILPFWMASMIDRLAIMIIPLLTLLFPLFKGVFPLYRWRVRKAIYKWYEILFDIDSKIENLNKTELEKTKKELLSLLKEIQDETKIPLSYMGEYYTLKEHAHLILYKIDERLDTNSYNLCDTESA